MILNTQMTEQEFLSIRKPFYIDSDTLLIKFPPAKFMDTRLSQWFTEYNIPFQFKIRGYLMETENHDNDYIMIYWNNYSIPNISLEVLGYLFNHFPNIKWIGLGCHIGKLGEIWKPQLKVECNRYAD